jgi:hypothetical protein
MTQTSSDSPDSSSDHSSVDYLDLGAVRIPSVPGLAVDIDLDPRSGVGKAFTLNYENSIAAIQVFAAAANEDLWPSTRDAIVQGLRDQKVDCDVVLGKFGTEISCIMPTVDLDGNAYVHPVRFIGISGPRWMQRIVVSGDAAVDGGAQKSFDLALSKIEVQRGEAPMAPGQRMEIVIPGSQETTITEEAHFGRIHIEL